MVKLLVDAGADPKITEDNGQTPMRVQHGLHGRKINALLLDAVRKRLGGKPERGQGLSFTLKRKNFDVAAARGVQEFRKFYYKGHPEWVVAMLRGPIDGAARSYVDILKPVRWEQDIAKRKISPGYKYLYIFQLEGSPWCIILRSLGFLRDVECMRKEARELSKRLDTPSYIYMAHDVSGAEVYEHFEKGELLEEATHCDGSFEFKSKLRPQPAFDPELFPDPVFADEGIYLPACYLKDDGYEIKLVLEGLQRDDVFRADMIVLED